MADERTTGAPDTDAIEQYHPYSITTTPFDVDTTEEPETGHWAVERTRADTTGVCMVAEHPTGEVLIASSFATEEKVDYGRVDVMFWRANRAWPTGDQSTVVDVDADEATPYDPFVVVMNAIELARRFAHHHDREQGWFDMRWRDDLESLRGHPDTLAEYRKSFFDPPMPTQRRTQYYQYKRELGR